MAKIGRNDPCPCGSGKKYKKCCMGQDSTPPSPPRLVTADGEEKLFLEAHYACEKPAEARGRLASADDFALVSADSREPIRVEAVFAWVERGQSAGTSGLQPKGGAEFPADPDDHRRLGHITLQGDRLTLQAIGRDRFAVGRKRLESLLAGLLRHRLDSVRSLEDELREAGVPEPGLEAGDLGRRSPIPAEDGRFSPLALGETLAEAIEHRGFESRAEANSFVEQMMEDYNHRPQDDLAGLSPLQVRGLLDAAWEDGHGPLRLDASLPPQEVAGTPLLHNTRLLVKQCEAEGGARVTSVGNLNRKTVAVLLPQLDFRGDRLTESELRGRSVVNEQDVWPLHLARIIAGLAGLIRKYKGSFVPTKRGRQLMREDQLPEL